MPELLSTRTPTARKWHRCDYCGTIIAPGGEYLRCSYLNDGHIYDLLSCRGCTAIGDTVWDWSGRPDEGIDYDTYAAWAEDNADDPAWGADARGFLRRIDRDQ